MRSIVEQFLANDYDSLQVSLFNKSITSEFMRVEVFSKSKKLTSRFKGGCCSSNYGPGIFGGYRLANVITKLAL
jgi:hypothetical protein